MEEQTDSQMIHKPAEHTTSLDKKDWEQQEKLHEAGVESFYGTGAQNYGEYHGGYLNFGLWEEGNTDYLKAAENLICHMGTTLGLTNESHLLDVACGMGPQDVYLHKNFGSRIDALDVTWKHVEHTRRRAKEAGFEEHILAHHGSATDLPFENETFTHVMSVEGPEHFDTREKFFHEAFRVLKPGGVMVLADYSIKRPPKTLFEKFAIWGTAKLWHVPKANIYGNEVYSKKLEKAGFRNVVIDEIGAKVIPGYYQEQKKKETRKEIAKIRGWFAAYPGSLIDYSVHKVFQDGLIEYVIVKAQKPKQGRDASSSGTPSTSTP